LHQSLYDYFVSSRPVFLFVQIGLPAIVAVAAVWSERSTKRLKRLPFVGWFVWLIAVWVLLSFFTWSFVIDTGQFLVVLAFFLAPFAYPAYRWIVRRARDAGIGKWIAYISIVPILNIIPFAFLALKPTSDRERANGSASPASAVTVESDSFYPIHSYPVQDAADATGARLTEERDLEIEYDFD